MKVLSVSVLLLCCVATTHDDTQTVHVHERADLTSTVAQTSIRLEDFKARLKSGDALFGFVAQTASPSLVRRLCIRQRADWVWIDLEHGEASLDSLPRLIGATTGTPTAPVVRVPSIDRTAVERSLDAGAVGIIFPMIRSADDATRAVQLTKYHPAGDRGFGPVAALDRWQVSSSEYWRSANDAIAVILLIETTEAISALDEIASVPGVDALFIGRTDLKVDLGLNPARSHEVIENLSNRIRTIGEKHSVAIGSFASDPASVTNYAIAGDNLLACGIDRELANESLSRLRNAFDASGDE